jgi:hypothetical protein
MNSIAVAARVLLLASRNSKNSRGPKLPRNKRCKPGCKKKPRL